MLARDRADAVVTAQELQRVIAARRALGRPDRRTPAQRTAGSPVVAPVTREALRVAPVLRAHDARSPTTRH
jgi:hypothetical protein